MIFAIMLFIIGLSLSAFFSGTETGLYRCLLYTSDAADE